MFRYLKNKFYEYVRTEPKDFNDGMKRIAVGMLIAMALISLVRIIDGPDHRLGTIQDSAPTQIKGK